MVGIRSELRAHGGYSLGKSTLPPTTTIELYTNPISDLRAAPNPLPPRPPPTCLTMGMASSDYYEHREAKLCLCHMATTLTFK